MGRGPMLRRRRRAGRAGAGRIVAMLPAVAPDLSWSPSPAVLAGAAIVLALYTRRFAHVRRAASPRVAADAPLWRLGCFAGAVALALVALVSPLDAMADDLFFAHMLQHVLLLDVVPILAILGLGKVLLRPVTRIVQRVERSAGVLAHPAAAVVAYVAVIWAWHIPAAYDA